MKKLTLLPVLLLATLQLNGALSRLAQAGRQFAPTLRSQLSLQPMRLPATMPGTCPMGMRLLSSSSRSQGGYNYAGSQQHARFGGREALLLGGAALAGKTVYDYWNAPEGRILKQAYAAETESAYTNDRRFNFNDILEGSETAIFNRGLNGYGATLDSPIWNNNPEADEQILNELIALESFITRDMASNSHEVASRAQEIYHSLKNLIITTRLEIRVFKLYRAMNSKRDVTEQDRAEVESLWRDALNERAKFVLEIVKITKRAHYESETLSCFRYAGIKI